MKSKTQFAQIPNKYNCYVFDLSKQKPPIASQPIRLEFNFSAAFNVADYVAHAIVLTPKLLRFSSDGQRHIDLLYSIDSSNKKDKKYKENEFKIYLK